MNSLHLKVKRRPACPSPRFPSPLLVAIAMSHVGSEHMVDSDAVAECAMVMLITLIMMLVRMLITNDDIECDDDDEDYGDDHQDHARDCGHDNDHDMMRRVMQTKICLFQVLSLLKNRKQVSVVRSMSQVKKEEK